MHIERINPWLTLLANIGVLAGLVVLIIEVRQNTSELQNEIDVAIWNMSSEQAGLVVQDAEFAKLLARAEVENWSEFSRDERYRLTVFWGLLVDRLELQFRLYDRSGRRLDMDSIVFPEQFLHQANFRNWWIEHKHIYHPTFITFFEELLSTERD